ncbi:MULTISPECIES: putative leader peptide [unclassified Streptomyces]|uniref:Leader peptide n=1 Tax=Streptomyces evansiae TaxID=3075535 RepID=A0ABD5EE60_9ACTN|nr:MULTISPECIES: putative leader peptide [unclassified Streptomyces]MDT0409331.1 putative leader peptide [Streptomyces sp. DSM 41979]MDT0419351.1 putative leader peptide [Streptomyces sp. DSM 41982]MDT0424703.1 putative leader peptide [Streptomyces sp. DSM 41859]
MVDLDVRTQEPGTPLLTARRHVDLCRVAGALCPR